jgi:hypothetical protein
MRATQPRHNEREITMGESTGLFSAGVVAALRLCRELRAPGLFRNSDLGVGKSLRHPSQNHFIVRPRISSSSIVFPTFDAESFFLIHRIFPFLSTFAWFPTLLLHRTSILTPRSEHRYSFVTPFKLNMLFGTVSLGSRNRLTSKAGSF